MKLLTLVTLCIFLAFNLEARENPFEMTVPYEEELARILEENENLAQKKQEEEKKIDQAIKILEKKIAKLTPKETQEKIETKPLEEKDLISKEVFPFLTFSYNDDKIIIKNKDSLLQKIILDKENKIALDYKRKIYFYTKKYDLNSKNFNKIAIGTHPEKSFYRIMIQLNSNFKDFTIEEKDDLFIISFRTN